MASEGWRCKFDEPVEPRPTSAVATGCFEALCVDSPLMDLVLTNACWTDIARIAAASKAHARALSHVQVLRAVTQGRDPTATLFTTAVLAQSNAGVCWARKPDFSSVICCTVLGVGLTDFRKARAALVLQRMAKFASQKAARLMVLPQGAPRQLQSTDPRFAAATDGETHVGWTRILAPVDLAAQLIRVVFPGATAAASVRALGAEFIGVGLWLKPSCAPPGLQTTTGPELYLQALLNDSSLKVFVGTGLLDAVQIFSVTGLRSDVEVEEIASRARRCALVLDVLRAVSLLGSPDSEQAQKLWNVEDLEFEADFARCDDLAASLQEGVGAKFCVLAGRFTNARRARTFVRRWNQHKPPAASSLGGEEEWGWIFDHLAPVKHEGAAVHSAYRCHAPSSPVKLRLV